MSRRLVYWLNVLIILSMLNSILSPVYLASAAPAPLKDRTIKQPVIPHAQFLIENAASLPVSEIKNDGTGWLADDHTKATIPYGPPSPPAEPRLDASALAQAQGQPGLMFIENVGQFDQRARFLVRGGPGTLHLAEDALWFTILEPTPIQAPGQGLNEGRLDAQTAISETRRGVHLKVTFPGANPQPRLEPFNRLSTKVSYFIGNDPTQWRPDVPVWGGVRYVDIYPGVDLEITGENGRLVQRFVVRQMPSELNPAPGERWGRKVRMRVEGADNLAVEGNRLRLTTAIGDFFLPLLKPTRAGGAPFDLPVAQPEKNGNEIRSPFSQAATASLAPVSPLERTHLGLASPLPFGMIPSAQVGSSDLLYGTYLSGDNEERAYDIAVDGAGNAYVTGWTDSEYFPTTAGAFDTSYADNHDVFVVKLNASGSGLIYATFLGDTNDEEGWGIDIDSAGNAYITGYTESKLFPTTSGAFDTSCGTDTNGTCNGGIADVFVTKLEADGTDLLYSTFLGGSSGDAGYSIAIDGTGNAFIAGSTSSSNFPVSSTAYDPTFNGTTDAFVFKLNDDGSQRLYATFLGGGVSDWSNDIALDTSGNAYVVGVTASSGFPTTSGAFDTSYGNNSDAFVAKLEADGTTLLYSTFLGEGNNDQAEGIAVDSAGNAYVVGYTNSQYFPTTSGAFDTSCGTDTNGTCNGGDSDAFVTNLEADGTALLYSTFLGGSGKDGDSLNGLDIAIDGVGNAYVTGATYSDDFPITSDAFQEDPNELVPTTGFISRLSADGTELIYSTYIGAELEDYPTSIALDNQAKAYISGWTKSEDFPVTSGAYDTSFNSTGFRDVFVVKLTLGNYLVSGTILDDDNNPLTNTTFLVTTAATSTTLTTTTTITPFIDTAGRYTLTDHISGTISVITATAQGFEMFPPFLFLPETGQVADADFVGTLPPDPLPVPTNTQFKGANWLRFLDDNPKGPTDYRGNGVGWNLEYATDFEYSDAPILQLQRLRDEQQIYTVMRLDKRLPPITELSLEEYDNCDNTRLQQWMKELDDQYTKANYTINDTNTVVAFIFNNEPNHYNPNTGAEDEGRAISAKHYADLYNCYYERWRVENNNPHSLLVAGPAQHGRPPGTYGPTDLGSENWETFLANLLPNLDGADGFAIHVYGYYGIKNEQINLFQNMLDAQVNQIRASHLAERPILISEYNPGVPANESDKDANDPAQGDGEDGWRDWFDKTYCWMQDAYTPQVRGALYFTDEEDSNRNEDSQDGWWISSLDRHDGTDPNLLVNRRQLWLDAPSEACNQILTMSKSSSGLSSPLVQNLTLSSQISRSISGVISGTLGVWGYDNIFYVTDDLEVPISQTLTIVPGTWLVFSPGQRLIVAGKLNVEANTVFPVRFISTAEAGWEGIHFQASAENSYCVGCYIENLSANSVALQVDASITFREGRIRDVPNGTAISSTIPFTLSNVVIDYVGIALQTTSLPTATHSVSHLTISRCQQGVINHGQTLILNNSILTTCGIAVTTKLSGTTAISYSLLHDNGKNFVTEAGAQLVQGTGLLATTPGFVDFPDNFHLQPDSAAVNAADPQADYSQEPGYNGDRADLGVYGNTREAPQQPPLDQMAVSLQTDTSVRNGQPGETVTYTLTVSNTGSVTDTYVVNIRSSHFRFRTSLFEDGYQGARQFILGPQEQISFVVWDKIRINSSQNLSNTFSVVAVGNYGVQDELQLTTLVSSFQESGGQVVMEAEHFSGQANQEEQAWLSQTNIAGYAGSAYLSALPDTDLQYTTTYTTNSPELQYTINFTTTGTYYVWLRGYAPNGAGDSVYTALDGQPAPMLTGFAPQTWSWANRDNQGNALAFEVTQPGFHTLHVWQREDGLRLDRILLTTDNSYNPVGSGPAESEIR